MFTAALVGGAIISTALGVVAIFVWPSKVIAAPVFVRFLVGFGATGIAAFVVMILIMPVIGFFSSRNSGTRSNTQGRD